MVGKDCKPAIAGREGEARGEKRASVCYVKREWNHLFQAPVLAALGGKPAVLISLHDKDKNPIT